MTYYIVKLLLSALVIVAVTETSKRSGYWGGVIASLPLVSILAITWLYIDTRDVIKVATLARSTVWFVLPSLPFFVVLPLMLQAGRSFAMSMSVSLLTAACCYVLMAFILGKFGVRL
jgi:Na+-driven multidrug efflux pump